MSDDEALLRAICEYPEEDIPRLMYADFLDETGEADRAAFIRAQVEAARQPDWEPFPVFCRHRKREWTHGKPWVSTLPEFPRGWNIVWGDPPFRRGFGWKVNVRSLFAWQQVAASVFETQPVGDLYLNPAATLDDWRQFAAADWARRLRVLRLDGARLNEPLLALRESDVPTAIEDVHLLRASSPGIADIITDLFQSRLSETVRGLHLRVGDGALDGLLDAIRLNGKNLERLSLVNMGIGPEFLSGLALRGGLRRLTELDLSTNPLDQDALDFLSLGLTAGGHRLPLPFSLTALTLADVHLEASGVELLARSDALSSLRRLDLSRNPLRPHATKLLAGAAPLAGLRSLNLSRCRIGEKGVRHLIHAKFWPNLVELDLRDNPITSAGAKHFLDAEVPRDLTALLLDGTDLGVEFRAALRRKFGDVVVFGHGERGA